MSKDLMQNSLKGYEANPLHQWFSRIVGQEEATRIFQEYHVGTSKKWGGSTVFWQTDCDDRIRGGKVIGYNQFDGKRVKGTYPQVTWVHSIMDMKDYNLKQCLFGEHLLKTRPEDPVAIVESEKTAIICSYFLKRHLWLATGGKNGSFNTHAMSVLKDREVVLVPDLGCENDWMKRGSQILSNIASNWKTYVKLAQIATADQKRAGNDIADIIITNLNNLNLLQFESEDITEVQDPLTSFTLSELISEREYTSKNLLDVKKMVDFKTDSKGNMLASLKDEYRECDSKLSNLDTLSSYSPDSSEYNLFGDGEKSNRKKFRHPDLVESEYDERWYTKLPGYHCSNVNLSVFKDCTKDDKAGKGHKGIYREEAEEEDLLLESDGYERGQTEVDEPNELVEPTNPIESSGSNQSIEQPIGKAECSFLPDNAMEESVKEKRKRGRAKWAKNKPKKG